ncbi:MAG: hypothetical protein HY584_04195, partial [Candidatus Omnitrophica bacterium]|nr:hypothetical protein [Candidatus Omnitrophota bacterium]
MTDRILIAESGSGFGGSAKYLASLLPLIDRNNFELEIVAYGSGPFIQEIEKGSWKVNELPDWRFPHRFTKRESFPTWIRLVNYSFVSAIQLILLVPQIVFWLCKNRIRLVHLNNEILSHLPL